jgi:uncharacterized membrane protein
MTHDARLLRALRQLIRFAVVGSVSLVLLGMLLCFAHHPAYLFSSDEMMVLKNPGSAMASEGSILLSALRLHGQSVTLTGLMILMVTPIAGVLLAVAFFLRERDWRMATVCAAVLVLLLLSALLGKAAG